MKYIKSLLQLKNMTDTRDSFQFEGNHSQEEAEKIEEKYKNLHTQLQQESAPYYASIQMWSKDRNGNYFSSSTWSDFIPTVAPETDYMIIIDMGIFQDEVYVIKQQKLLELLGDSVQSIEDPARYYILPGTRDVELKKQILENSAHLKTNKRFEHLEGVSSPAGEKYFIKLLIHSFSEMTVESRCVLIFFQGNPDTSEIYCSKVNPGQTLQEVLEKEVAAITGDKKFLIDAVEDDGTDADRHGNQIQRYAISILVPYFDTKGKKLQGMNMGWKRI